MNQETLIQKAIKKLPEPLGETWPIHIVPVYDWDDCLPKFVYFKKIKTQWVMEPFIWVFDKIEIQN